MINTYILNQTGTMMINSDCVERFQISEKSDTVLLVASTSHDTGADTLARYKDFDEAKRVLRELLKALANFEPYFAMPEDIKDKPDGIS